MSFHFCNWLKDRTSLTFSICLLIDFFSLLFTEESSVSCCIEITMCLLFVIFEQACLRATEGAFKITFRFSLIYKITA